jgi:hypothetical protein
VWTLTNTACGYYASAVNTSASLTFNGTNITCNSRTFVHAFYPGVAVYVLGNHNRFGGVVRITLDGEAPQSIDLYGAVTCGEVLFSKTGLANGQHSIKLEHAGMSPNVTPTSGYPDGLTVLTNFMCVFHSPANCYPLTSMITQIYNSGCN